MVEAHVKFRRVLSTEGDNFFLVMVQLLLQHYNLLQQCFAEAAMLLAIATEGSKVETTHALEGNAGETPLASDEAVTERVVMDRNGAWIPATMH